MNTSQDQEHIIRDKYNGDASKLTQNDRDRLAAGEPTAYIIGWVPFLGCHIDLSSHPLIPRPETEYWTDLFIKHADALKHSQGAPVRVLDLCAGSGAIGIAIAKHLTDVHVTFSELDGDHVHQIKKNLLINAINPSTYSLYTGDLFESLHDKEFDYIVSNPPYIPENRSLPKSVTDFEPSLSLYAGPSGIDCISNIIQHAGSHLLSHGELWIECDTENIADAQELATQAGFATRIVPDQYARNRVLVAY